MFLLTLVFATQGAAADPELAYPPPLKPADDGLQVNERGLSQSLAIKKTQESVNDVVLNEAVRILSDSAALNDGESQMAASALSTRPVVVTALSTAPSKPER